MTVIFILVLYLEEGREKERRVGIENFVICVMVLFCFAAGEVNLIAPANT